MTDRPLPCTVWWAAPVEPTEAPGLVKLLDGHESDRLARFRRPADQARYLAAHALVRLVLGDLLDVAADRIVFDRTCRCGGQHGKPRLPGRSVPGFSLTHADELVGVAVRPDGQVGIDVERIRPMTDLAGMARHISSPAELARPGPVSPATFFAAWTRKEALLKATGDGLAVPMATITLAPTGAAVQERTAPHGPAEPMWLQDLHPAPGYAAALAGPGTQAMIVKSVRCRPHLAGYAPNR